jgi:biopolymer transport protein ExbD
LALINVVFLLLLFFVVTGTIVYQHDRSIVPPTSVMLTPGKAPADAVYIDAEGTLRFRGTPQGAAEIARTLLAGAGGNAEGQSAARTVQVVADRRLKARSLLAIIEELRGHGLHSLSIVTVRDSAR